MSYRITKTFTFSASHALTHLPPEHQCHRLHGHNYAVTMILQREDTGPDGFVRDFGDLDIVKQYIDRNLDHRHLNDVLGEGLLEHGRATTSEFIAWYFYQRFKSALRELVGVRVSETDKTSAEYWGVVP